MMSYFHKLGARVGTAWQAAGNEEHAFAPIATQALCEDPPSRHVAIAEVSAWLLDPAQSIEQPAMNPFGQPPVVVFAGPRFRIEALFWLESTTSIHQHSFAGAFTVLGGTSFHSTFEFIESDRVNTRLRFGSLHARGHELLRPGDVRGIQPGDTFIHQVTHLQVPTVSVVIRTDGSAMRRPQLSYELPGIALDLEDESPVLTRRRAMLELLSVTQKPAMIDTARRWILYGDLESVYHLMTHVAPYMTTVELARLGVELVRRHGWIGEQIARACDHRRRVYAAAAIRAQTRDPRLRLLVAALMLRCSPTLIGRLLAEHDQSTTSLADAILALARTGVLGLEVDELTSDLVGALLGGATPATLLHILGEDYELEALMAHHEVLIERARQVCEAPLLAPLFDAAGWSQPVAASQLTQSESDA